MTTGDPSNATPTATSAVPPTATSAGKPGKGGSQAVVLNRVPGDGSGACIKVDGLKDVRSGSIMGGPFDAAVASWGTVRQGTAADVLNLYWVPLHADTTKPMLSVEATRVGSKERATASSSSLDQAEDWQYFTTDLTLKTSGTWRLKVTAGPDSGCFQLILAD